jgi:hypothetical protein
MEILKNSILSSNEELDKRIIGEYDKWVIDNFLKCWDEFPDQQLFVRNVLYDFLALKDNYKQ